MLVASGGLLVVGVIAVRQNLARGTPIADHRSPMTDQTSA